MIPINPNKRETQVSTMSVEDGYKKYLADKAAKNSHTPDEFRCQDQYDCFPQHHEQECMSEPECPLELEFDLPEEEKVHENVNVSCMNKCRRCDRFNISGNSSMCNSCTKIENATPEQKQNCVKCNRHMLKSKFNSCLLCNTSKCMAEGCFMYNSRKREFCNDHTVRQTCVQCKKKTIITARNRCAPCNIRKCAACLIEVVTGDFPKCFGCKDRLIKCIDMNCIAKTDHISGLCPVHKKEAGKEWAKQMTVQQSARIASCNVPNSDRSFQPAIPSVIENPIAIIAPEHVEPTAKQIKAREKLEKKQEKLPGIIESLTNLIASHEDELSVTIDDGEDAIIRRKLTKLKRNKCLKTKANNTISEKISLLTQCVEEDEILKLCSFDKKSPDFDRVDMQPIRDAVDSFDISQMSMGLAFGLQAPLITGNYRAVVREFMSKLDIDNRKGLSYFEMFDCEDPLAPMVKPHWDYDETIETEDTDYVNKKIHKVLRVLCHLFSAQPEDFAISEDCRWVTKEKDGVEKRLYKVSIHFVLWTTKVHLNELGAFVKHYLPQFTINGITGIDMAIYRGGLNKFRPPYSKKNREDPVSMMKPLNYKGVEDLHKHMVTITDYCRPVEFSNLIIDGMTVKKIKNVTNVTCDKKIQLIVDRYSLTLLSDVGTQGNGNNSCSLSYNILDKRCGIQHENNNNYLVFNKRTGLISVRCHSQRCTGFIEKLNPKYVEPKQTSSDFPREEKEIVLDEYVGNLPEIEEEKRLDELNIQTSLEDYRHERNLRFEINDLVQSNADQAELLRKKEELEILTRKAELESDMHTCALADLWNMDHLCTADNTNTYVEVREAFERQFVYIRSTNEYFNLDYEKDIYTGQMRRVLVPFLTQGFSDLYYHTWNDKIEGPEREAFFPEYRGDKDKQAYRSVKFEPISVQKQLDLKAQGRTLNYQSRANVGHYNMFPGFGFMDIITDVEAANIPQEAHEEFAFWLEHIKDNICGGFLAKQSGDAAEIALAEKSFDYLMQYLGNMFQNPKFVPCALLVLFSKYHGTGKSSFTKMLESMLGRSLAVFCSIEQSQEKHSVAHCHTLMNVFEEIEADVSFKYHAELKDMAQRRHATFNQKNKPIQKINTFVRYFQTTNECDGVYFTDKDRRTSVFTFRKVEDRDTVRRIDMAMRCKYVKYLFGMYLSKYNISLGEDQRSWEDARPLTADYYRMMSGSITKQFFNSLINKDDELEVSPEMYYYEKDVVVFDKRLFQQVYTRYLNANTNKTLSRMRRSKKLTAFIDNRCAGAIQEKSSRRFNNRRMSYWIHLPTINDLYGDKDSEFLNRYEDGMRTRCEKNFIEDIRREFKQKRKLQKSTIKTQKVMNDRISAFIKAKAAPDELDEFEIEDNTPPPPPPPVDIEADFFSTDEEESESDDDDDEYDSDPQ